MATKQKFNQKTAAIAQRYESIALVLQGGGALGAYQAGVYEALIGTGYQLDWIAGVSIGAVNAALIAGNPPERRLQRLQEFWQLVSSDFSFLSDNNNSLLKPIDLTQEMSVDSHGIFNRFSALWAASFGIAGFYKPRIPPAYMQTPGTIAALSIYDSSPLRATLERLVDFDLINSKKVRLSVGAVNVRTGNSIYFDNHECRIGPEHIMASGALPPAFPPIIIEGEAYWDGGTVSNTPLQYVLDKRPKKSLLVLQVDLFSARGEMPTTLENVYQRQKDILYSSRTRYNSNMAEELANTRAAICDLLKKLPANLKQDPSVQALREALHTTPTDIVHLIYRQAAYEQESKDYEFSRLSVLEHWQAGQKDLCDTIHHPEWLESLGLEEGITQYDLTRHAPTISIK